MAEEPSTSVLAAWGRSLVDLVFPPRCCGCYSYTPSARGADRLCPACAAALERQQLEPYCPRCASEVAPYEVAEDRCGECREVSQRAEGMVRVAGYTGLMGALLRSYKYRGREQLGPALGRMLAKAVSTAPWRERIEAVVAVPTHWRHRLDRQLHAAEALAAHVAQATKLPYLPLLRRVRAGPHQVGLGTTHRYENVRGAFALHRGVVLAQARILVVDDVRTTGATLEECAKVLRQGGAAEVYGAVVLRAGVGQTGV